MKNYNFRKLVRKLRKKKANDQSVFPRANDLVENRKEGAADQVKSKAKPDSG